MQFVGEPAIFPDTPGRRYVPLYIVHQMCRFTVASKLKFNFVSRGDLSNENVKKLQQPFNSDEGWRIAGREALNREIILIYTGLLLMNTWPCFLAQ